MKSIVFKYFIAVLIVCSSQVYAASYQCSGIVKGINQNYTGTIYLISEEIYGNSVGRKICSLSAEWNGVSIETCNGWLAKLLSSEARNTPITI